MLNKFIKNIKSVFFYIIWHHLVVFISNCCNFEIVFVWLGVIWLILPVLTG